MRTAGEVTWMMLVQVMMLLMVVAIMLAATAILMVMVVVVVVVVTDLRVKGDDVQHAAEGAVRVHLTQIRGEGGEGDRSATQGIVRG